MSKPRLFILIHEFPQEWPTGVYVELTEGRNKEEVFVDCERNDASLTVLSEFELKRLWRVYQKYKKDVAAGRDVRPHLIKISRNVRRR